MYGGAIHILHAVYSTIYQDWVRMTAVWLFAIVISVGTDMILYCSLL